MANTFSFQSIKEMEPVIDRHVRLLRQNLDKATESEGIVDLKALIAFYVLDVLGDLAFGRSFDSQRKQALESLPPINDHIYLACMLGMMPDVMPYVKSVLNHLPLPWVQRLLTSRRKLRDLTAECVQARLDMKTKRKDLLSCLINAVDPGTGARLTQMDINTEAFAMIVAGSHTTSGTLTLLFAHLLQNQSVLEKIIEELDSKLPDTVDGAYLIEGLEENLPYTMACIQENFRINPVFTMPLMRRVTAVGGISIGEHVVPKGVSLNLVLCREVLQELTYLTDRNFLLEPRDPAQFIDMGS